MTLVIADNVRETSITNGTGALTLTAVSGFRRFRDVCAIGDEFDYRITQGANWEIGVGHYTGTDQLTRTYPQHSSNAGAAVSFSADPKDVVLTFSATRAKGTPNRNLLVNSSFRFWQRGTSLTLADGAMGPDGWFLLSESGSVSCIPGSGFYGQGVGKYAIASVSSTQRIGFGQVLFSQDAYDLDNFWFQCEVTTNATRTIRAAVLYGGGTEDAQTRDMVNNWSSTTYTAGNFFHANWVPLAVASQSVEAGTPYRFSFPITVPGSHKNLGVLIWTETQLTSGNEFYIGEPILSDAGAPQIYRPPSYSEELLACHRRFCKSFPIETTPANNAGFIGAFAGQAVTSSLDPEFYWRFPTTMGKAPTVTLYNPTARTAGQWDNASAALANARSYYPSDSSVVIDNTDTAGTTGTYFIHATAEAEPCS